ncbi:MAG: MaoC family dehydratase N-terminal domain-containing protein [Deltaproteobacteria bacterium]|nr:MaoC family dehydratase N-terminal domain-containing protein [Deltaproteobacteria bacterium]
MPGKYFDDLHVGDEFTTVSRTVTEADIVNFCGVSGDFNQLHTDVEFAAKTTFGQRIAHGMCGMTIASGCLNRSGLIEGTTVAFKGIREWRFSAPIHINDTIYVNIKVKNKTVGKKPDRGLVIFWVSVVNQHEEVVMEGQWDILLSRSVEGEPS